MSKKNKKLSATPDAGYNAGMGHEAEYRIIKLDLVKVVILNAVYLAVILFLYFGNQRSHFVDNWFAKVLHF